MRKRRRAGSVPIRNDLIHQLGPAAQEGLSRQLAGWPGDPYPPSHMQEVIASSMFAARKILRLYDWKPDPPDDYKYLWPWRTIKFDTSPGTQWRPIGPDWEPKPFLEHLACFPDLDPCPFYPDLRFAAFDWLYWLAALREASNVGDAALAAWRAADARAELWQELQLGPTIRAGDGPRRGGETTARGRSDPDRQADMEEADRKLLAAGIINKMERARKAAPRFGIEPKSFRNAVDNPPRKKVVDN